MFSDLVSSSMQDKAVLSCRQRSFGAHCLRQLPR